MAEAVASTMAPDGGFHVSVGARTDTGRVRSNNQDSVGTWKDLPQTVPFMESGYLFAVADGVGGNERGEVASALAIETLFHTYYSDDTTDVPAALKRAFRRANEAVYELASNTTDERQPGTTLVAGVIKNRMLTVGNVGDSRAYLFRGRTNTTQISKDHSLVAEAVRAGQMTAEEARTSRQRNVITRALGARQKVDVDIFEVDLMSGDVIVLCSDGLHGLAEDEEIKQVVQALPPEQAANELIEIANNRNSHDNVTAVVVKAEAEAPALTAPKPMTERTTAGLPVVPEKRGFPIGVAVAAVIILAVILVVVAFFFLR